MEKIDYTKLNNQIVKQAYDNFILTNENFKVEEALDGKDALQKIEKLKLDLILCDIKMPGGMDGLELLQKFQKQIPETPVVMISGHGNIETAVEAVKKELMILFKNLLI